jgi:rhodanese-related sulfurtransferase
MKKNLVVQILIILCMTVISGILFNLFAGNGLSLIYTPLEVKPGSHLDIEETYRLLREGQALFIDTRYKKEFDVAHIPGSVNIPSNLSRDDKMASLDAILKDRMIVVYCSSESCQTARRLAGIMTYLGFEHVHVYLAGFEEWLEHKYPVARGDQDQR